MARRNKRQLIRWRSLLLLLRRVSFSASIYRSLALFVAVLLLSSAGATATSISIAQQPATSSPNATTTDKQQAFARAQQLFEQAGQLRQQGTAESQQQALAKYEEALKIWQELAVNEAPPYAARGFEASTLLAIGTIYYIQSESQKALDYFEQGLAIRRELKNRLQEAIARISTDNAGSNSDDKQKLLDTYKDFLTTATLGEASLLDSLGNAYYSLGENQKALEYYNQALSLFRAEKKPSLEAITLRNIGDVYFKLGETQSSFPFYNQALEIQRAQKDTAAQAKTLQKNIGLGYTLLGESQKALTAYNQALELQQERKDLAEQADILSSIGSLYYGLGQYQKARDSYNQALKLQQVAQGNLSGTALIFNLSQQAEILTGIANIYYLDGLGDPAKVLNLYNQARSLYQKAGNRPKEALLLYYISFVYDELGETKKALDFLNQALVLHRAISFAEGEASTLRQIADIYNSMGEPQQALDFYNQALDIQRRMNDRYNQAVTLYKIASVYSSLGDYQLSIDTYNQALEIFKNISERTRQAMTLVEIGSVYQKAKDYQKSLDYHNQALASAKQTNNFSLQATVLASMVVVYESLKDYPKALDAANQILLISRQQDNGFGETMSFVMSGRVYLASGDYPKALEATQKAVTGHRKVGNRLGEANALRNLGKIYNSLKQYEKAVSTYDRSLALRRMLGDRPEEAKTLYNVAITQRDQGNLNEARTQIEAAIKIVEDIRTRVTSQELRTSYFASVQNYYQFYIDVLMQLHKKDPSQGYDALALHASERDRARSLLELLTEANADIRQGVEPKLLEQERTLQQKLDAVEKRRIELLNGQWTNKQVEALEKETATLLEEYRQVQAQIRATSPRYAELTQPKPLTLAEIQQQVLDDDTILLEYSLGEERSYLWAVTKTSITSYELPKRNKIEAAAKQFYDLLNDRGYHLGEQRGLFEVTVVPNRGSTEAVPKLSQMLLQPVAQQLGNKRLLIVSDGALQYLPFAALPIPPTPRRIKSEATSGFPLKKGGERANQDLVPLLVEHEIVNLPSASTLAVLRKELNGRKIAPKAIALLADPVFEKDDARLNSSLGEASGRQLEKSSVNRLALERSARIANVTFNRLPFTRQEAEKILALVPTTERLQAFDFAANRAIATNPELSQYRIVHFATHGILNSVHPELSGVVLSLLDEKGESQNGFLRLHDVFNLNLPAELVVLSACETGLGEEVKGEGLVGLTRGFMYAGAPRVVVSLWSVSDRATSELMTKFYQGMLEKNLQPAAALRAAQIEMWQKTEWKSPYYWAAFVLQGEWN
ncbi:tetratricopeptide repeat protein [Coleofasciculus sp. H7-2]|uniref:tetratricopeptide repeat protein n=1 Tax=Coleofasciculus sp. H7-2 TaxID=3351545 RepID=UPI0036730003